MRWLWFALGFVAVALALLAQWPAAMAARWVGARTPLQLIEPRGTIWNGSAQQLQVTGLNAGQIKWQLSALSLLRLRPRLTVQTVGAELVSESTLTRLPDGAWIAEAVIATLPGEWLQRVLADTGLGMSGTIELALDEVRLDSDGWLTAIAGEAFWRRAQVIGSVPVALGDLKVAWTTPRTGRMEGRLTDLGGPLELTGMALIKSRQYRIDATLRARDDNPVLRNALFSLARPNGAGQVTLSWQGPMLSVGVSP